MLNAKLSFWNWLFLFLGIILGTIGEEISNMQLEEMTETLFYLSFMALIYLQAHNKNYIMQTENKMNDWLQREELLIGKENIEKLKNSKVIIFGLGGVGGSAIEAIVRAGINNIALVDCDKISETNINRQIFATTKTIGKLKVEAAKERLIEINPNLNIEVYNLFFNKENSNGFDFSKYDYIIDAIDTVSSKIELIVCAKKATPK